MKNATRKLALVLVAVVMVLSLVLTACGTKHDFTVKVVDADGNPYTAALVQPCVVDDTDPSGLGACYEGIATDKNGVAHFDLGKEIPDTSVEEIEIHLLNLPGNMTYEKVRMKKGETKTVTVIEGSGGPNLKTPIRGTGTGEYYGESLFGAENQIVSETFDPYVVVTGSYALTFTSATQKIYYAFQPFFTGNYKVYSTGYIDPSITRLTGSSLTGAIYCWQEDEFQNDNVSATDKNFSYNFTVDQNIIDSEGYVFFEVALEYALDVGEEAVITFEYVSDVQGGNEEVTDVYATEDLIYYGDPEGEYHAMPLDGTATYAKDADGYYHVGDENGEIIVANLVYPRGLALGFVAIVQQGASLIFFEDATHGKDYFPMVSDYTDHANSDGRYPLTDELKDFLNAYLTDASKVNGELYDRDSSGEPLTPDTPIDLPDTDPWLVWCGYYENETTPTVNPNGGNNDDSNQLPIGNNVTIVIPESGTVTYTYQSFSSVKLTLKPFDDTSTFTIYYYTNLQDPEDATLLQLTTDDEVTYYELEIEGRLLYSFVFSTVDGTAASLGMWITAEVPQEEEGSTMDNPIVIDTFGPYTNETEQETGPGGTSTSFIYYSYTVQEGDTALYFAWSDDTQIQVLVGYKYYYSTDDEEAEILTNGLDVSELVGQTITIIVTSDTPGEVSFEIYNTPISND